MPDEQPPELTIDLGDVRSIETILLQWGGKPHEPQMPQSAELRLSTSAGEKRDHTSKLMGYELVGAEALPIKAQEVAGATAAAGIVALALIPALPSELILTVAVALTRSARPNGRGALHARIPHQHSVR